MKFSLWVVIALVVFGCEKEEEEKDDSSATSKLAFAKSGLESAAVIKGGTLALADFDPGTSTDNDVSFGKQNVTSFFKLECHVDDADFCPSGVTKDDNNKFSTTTLFGLLYHAELYSKDVYNVSDEETDDSGTGGYTDCPTLSTGDAQDITGLSGLGFSPSDSSTFFIDLPNLFECLTVSTIGSTTQNFVYSKAGSKPYAVIATRKNEDGGYGPESNVMQMYARMGATREVDGTTQQLVPELVMANIVGASDTNSDGAVGTSESVNRGIVIMNVSTHRFVAKYTIGTAYISAMGQGGYDFATSAWVDGYYVVRSQGYLSDASPVNFCIKNGESPTIQSDTTNCEDGTLDGFLDASSGYWSDVTTYLGMSTDDKTYLANLESYFDNANFLSDSNIPSSLEQFPDQLAKQ